MRCTLLVSLLMILILTTSTKSDTITTGNLVTNGNFETGNANGWTTSGDVQVLNDCCELNGVTSTKDLEFGDSGSIEQDFNLSSDTITQNMLDNGITLDSSIDAQNGECNVAGCWGGQGNADTFTNVLTIKDSDGNVLASNTTIRTDVTGINGAIFTDIFILPTLDPVPLYINLSVNIAPSIPVTSVLIVVLDASTLPSESFIVSTLVNVSALPLSLIHI